MVILSRKWMAFVLGAAVVVNIAAILRMTFLANNAPESQSTKSSADKSLVGSELSTAYRRIAELEKALQAERVHQIQLGAIHSSVLPGRDEMHTQIQRPIVHIRGGAAEQVGVNFTLFDITSIERFEVWQPNRTRLFIAIISSQSDRAAKQRRLIRKTWLAQIRRELEPSQVVARFFVGRQAESPVITEKVVEEIHAHGDVVVVDVGDTYGGLIAKVQGVLQWIIGRYRADYVGKFDDDCYVAPAALLTTLNEMPSERLYFGKMMGGGPVQRNGGRNAEPNLPRGVDWFPPYASGGGGYVLSWDLVHAVAFPPVKMLDMVNEDGHMGLFLLPYDVNRRSSNKFYPYGVQQSSGQCTPAANILAVHYVKDSGDHDCMAAIHANVSAGKPVCESRFCGPLTCDFKFPRPRKFHTKRCLHDVGKSTWSSIDPKRSCEVSAAGPKRFFAAKRMRKLECCLQLCEEMCDCNAVDYFRATAWCNLYEEACKSPRKATEGASSFRLDRGVQ